MFDPEDPHFHSRVGPIRTREHRLGVSLDQQVKRDRPMAHLLQGEVDRRTTERITGSLVAGVVVLLLLLVWWLWLVLVSFII